MKKWNGLRLITYVLLLVLIAAVMGCGKTGTDGNGTYFHHSLKDLKQDEETQTAEPEETKEEMYLVVGVDQMEETLRLYRYANGMEYRYYYGTGTRFLDKYGNRTTVVEFVQGLLITIGNVNSEGILCEAQISGDAWVYEDVTRFRISSDPDMLQIGDSKYQYDEETYVFSDDERVTMDTIAQGDTLFVVGVDKKILSVRITTAQGTLALTNTTLFEGSFLQLGSRIFTEVTRDLAMKVPEGTYELTVANNGWGGSRQVTIERGQTTTVDLDKMKGKGPKSGKVRFLIDVADSVLLIDNKEVDDSEPIRLTYGQHTIAVYADGYDVWRRNLFVNSKKSTVIISLKDEEKSTEADRTSEQEDTSSGSTEAKESTQNSTADTQGSESTKRKEELDLIKDLLSSMTDSSSLVSK